MTNATIFIYALSQRFAEVHSQESVAGAPCSGQFIRRKAHLLLNKLLKEGLSLPD
jgi:hypothetical protein